MISKCLKLFFVFFVQSVFTLCQINVEHNKKGIYFDVDNLPVFQIDSLNNGNVVDYYILTKEKVSRNICYKGGYKSLSAFCDSLYFNREDYSYDELNAQALYTILFDKNLQIKEIKIIERIAYDNLKYDYDNLIKRILFLTEGNWIKKDEDNCNSYFYLGFFNLR